MEKLKTGFQWGFKVRHDNELVMNRKLILYFLYTDIPELLDRYSQTEESLNRKINKMEELEGWTEK